MKKILFIAIFLLTATLGASAQNVGFVASLSGAQAVPVNNSAGVGVCRFSLNTAQTHVTVGCTFSGLGSSAATAHVHGPAGVGANAPVLFELTGVPAATSGSVPAQTFAVAPAQIADLRAHRWYIDIHTSALPDGELRGQIKQTRTVSDYDGDGRTDAIIYRSSSAQFWMRSSLNGTATAFDLGAGTNADGFNNNTWDFDGDGRADPVMFRVGGNSILSWHIFQTSTNTVRVVQWGDLGSTNDNIAPADYDGDGIQDVAVFRRTTGDWWVIRSSDGARTATKWGAFNDFPAVGDYDGDGRDDLTTVRREGGQHVWYIRRSSDGAQQRIPWGLSPGDAFFFNSPFDIDGDGRQDIMVTREENNQRFFHILRSSDGGYSIVQWGTSASTPLLGDYDGDGLTDIVARRGEGLVGGGTGLVWYVRRSSDGAASVFHWGSSSDQ